MVVGAGPAGAIAALVLARAGVRVRVLDRARFPRFKLCGDSVNPGALAILTRLGLAAVVDGALPVDGMIVTSESGVRAEGRYGDGRQGRMISRHRLDDALLVAARAAGACVEEGVLVREPIVDVDGVSGVLVTAGDRPCRLRAPIVIAADGASSRVARALGLARHARSSASLGRWCVFRRGWWRRGSGPVRRDAPAQRTLHRYRPATWRADQRVRGDRRSCCASRSIQPCCATRCDLIHSSPPASPGRE